MTPKTIPATGDISDSRQTTRQDLIDSISLDVRLDASITETFDVVHGRR